MGNIWLVALALLVSVNVAGGMFQALKNAVSSSTSKVTWTSAKDEDRIACLALAYKFLETAISAATSSTKQKTDSALLTNKYGNIIVTSTLAGGELLKPRGATFEDACAKRLIKRSLETVRELRNGASKIVKRSNAAADEHINQLASLPDFLASDDVSVSVHVEYYPKERKVTFHAFIMTSAQADHLHQNSNSA